MERLLEVKEEAENWIDAAQSMFPGDEVVAKFKIDLENLFQKGERNPKESNKAAVDEEKGKTNPLAIVVYDEVDGAKEFDACWECPQFVSSVTEKVDLEVQKSEIRRSLSNSLSSEGGIEAPGFDLGISPEKKGSGSMSVQSNLSAPPSAMRQSSSAQSKDKGKRAVTFSPIPMTCYFDDSEETYEHDVQLEKKERVCRNFQDSGVFVMRVMETFMGDTKSWRTGFDQSEKKQEQQLIDLKAKYVSKILLSNCNKNKGYVQDEVVKFFTIPANVRADMLKYAKVDRWNKVMG